MNEADPHTSTPTDKQNDASMSVEVYSAKISKNLLRKIIGYLSSRLKIETPETEPCYSCSNYTTKQIQAGLQEGFTMMKNRIFLPPQSTNLCMVEPQKARNRKSTISHIGKHVLI